MVDFSQFTHISLDSIKRPPVLPSGDYLGVITHFTFGESAIKKTPYVKYSIKLIDWPNSVSDSDKLRDGAPIDLSKKQFSADFYLSPDALFMLKDFLINLGISSSLMADEAIPQAVGCQVLVPITQKLSERDDEIFNPARVERLLAA